MALVVWGRMEHPEMSVKEVRAALASSFGTQDNTTYDFEYVNQDCRVEFFCQNNRTLDITVKSLKARRRAPSTVYTLVREVEGLRRGISGCKDRRLSKKAGSTFSILDDSPETPFLELQTSSTHTSAVAKATYWVIVLLALLGVALAFWWSRQPAGTVSVADTIGWGLAIAVALLANLLFLIDRVMQQTEAWVFDQRTGAS